MFTNIERQGYSFTDHARALAPSRHDLVRRADADWVAGLEVRGIVDMADAEEIAHDLACYLVCRAVRARPYEQFQRDWPTRLLL